MISTDRQLLSAGNGEVKAWNWSEIVKKVTFSLTPPTHTSFSPSHSRGVLNILLPSSLGLQRSLEQEAILWV